MFLLIISQNRKRLLSRNPTIAFPTQQVQSLTFQNNFCDISTLLQCIILFPMESLVNLLLFLLAFSHQIHSNLISSIWQTFLSFYLAATDLFLLMSYIKKKQDCKSLLVIVNMIKFGSSSNCRYFHITLFLQAPYRSNPYNKN